MVLRSSAWSLPWEKVILMMLLTPFGVDLWNTLLYHLEALQLSFSPFFLCSFPTLSEGYNTYILPALLLPAHLRDASPGVIAFISFSRLPPERQLWRSSRVFPQE